MASEFPPTASPSVVSKTGSRPVRCDSAASLKIVYELADEIDILPGEAELLWSLLGSDIMECLAK